MGSILQMDLILKSTMAQSRQIMVLSARKLGLFILALAVVSSLQGCLSESPSAPSLNKPAGASNSLGRLPLPDFEPQELVSLTCQDFRGLDWRWLKEGPYALPLEGRSGTHTTEGYIQGLLKLGRSAQKVEKDALVQVKRCLRDSAKESREDMGFFADMLLAARLAIYDADAWKSFVADFTRNGRSDAALKDSLVPILLQMPLSLRNMLYEQINQPKVREQLEDSVSAYYRPGLYEWAMSNKRGVTKKCYKRRSDGQCVKMAPKRCIDAFVRYTSQVDAHFSLAPRSPVELYDAFIETQRGLLFQNSDVARYTGSDVIEILKNLRAHISGSEAWPSRGADLSGYGHDDQAFLLAFGSIVNGRGVLRRNPNLKVKFAKDGAYFLNNESFSDFDVYINPHSAFGVVHSFARSAYSHLLSSLSQPFRNDTDLRARFQVDPFEQHAELNSSTLSPLSIRIDQAGLYLLVYPALRYSEIPHSLTDSKRKRNIWARDPQKRIFCLAIEGICPSAYKSQAAQPSGSQVQ